MAWLLVLNQDPESSKNTKLDTQKFKRGDVLDVFPDEWEPTHLEKSNPLFKIIKVPGEPSSYADLMDSDDAFSSDATTIPPRKRRLDLDDMDSAVAIEKKVDAKGGDILEVPLAEISRIRTKMKVSEVLDNPQVIK